MSEQLKAPFMDEVVEALKRYQASDFMHPYTCCNHQVMEVSTKGLTCPKCGRLQDWVLHFTAEG